MATPWDHAQFFLLVILFFWFTSSPDTSTGLLSATTVLVNRLTRQRAAHGVLAGSKWGDFSPSSSSSSPNATADATPIAPAEDGATGSRYLNMTGFREEDGYAWGDLGRFKDRCLEWSRNANPPARDGELSWDLARAQPTWQNATGIVQGQWVRRDGSERRSSAGYNLTQISSSAVAWMGSEFGRNVTGREGKMLLRLEDKQKLLEYAEEDTEEVAVEDGQQQPQQEEEEKKKTAIRTGSLVREVSASASIEDATGTGSTYDVRLHGVHWPRQGAMLLTTTSDKFAGIFGLPHLAPGVNFFHSSRQLLNASIDEVLRKKEASRFPDFNNPWSSDAGTPQEMWSSSPHCEYVMWLQVHPLDAGQLQAAGRQDPGYGERGGANEEVAGLIGQIEDELRFPTGRPLSGGIPDLQISAVVYSPDCAFFLESKGPPEYAPVPGEGKAGGLLSNLGGSKSSSSSNHLVGMKDEVFAHSAKVLLVAFAVVMFGQIQLLKVQMRESSTPSTIGRVSFWTAGVMVMADGLVFGAASFWSLSASATLLPSLLLTYAGFISMTIGGSFLYEVYKVQEPERRNRERERGQAAAVASAAAAAAAAAAARVPSNFVASTTDGTLPSTAATPGARPASAPIPAARARPVTPPIIIPSDQDIDAEIAQSMAALASGASALPLLPIANPNRATTTTTTITPTLDTPTPFSAILGCFVLVGLVLLFVSLAATTWWSWARAAYVNALVFAYLSLWVPQIARNVARNSRRAFSWRFMVGQSVLRLLPVSYFYLRSRNLAFARPDWNAFALLAGWVWCQLWVLAFQDVLGPRFGVPKGWAPEAWDYHPVLREDGLEAAGLPIGLMGDGGGGSSSPTSPASRRRRSSSSLAADSGGGGSGWGKAGGGFGAAASDRHTRIRTMDCAICREVLEVPVVKAGHSDPSLAAAGGGVAGMFARRQYMVTPCRHIFHSACLEGWLRFRLQCPICREDLPPL